MRKSAQVVSLRPQEKSDFNPLKLTTGLNPSFTFKWGDPGEKNGIALPKSRKKKRRMISRPNADMRILHKMFEEHLQEAIQKMGREKTYGIRYLPTATGCVKGSNPLLNIKHHERSEFFYITDFREAYPSVDLRRLAILLTYIEYYDYYRVDYSLRTFSLNELAQYEVSCDPAFQQMEGFVQIAFGGLYGKGLAVGGRLSPYLMNLYCEVFLDSRLRLYFLKRKDISRPSKDILCTRYVDDLVCSSQEFISSDIRKDIRKMIGEAGFEVKHLKSFVLKRSMGTVFVTKLGMRVENVGKEEEKGQKGILTYPQKKRRRINGILQSFLKPIPKKEGDISKLSGYQNDSPEVVSGMIAEFLHYYKNVKKPTESDKKTFALCKEFEQIATPYLIRAQKARERKRKDLQKRKY